MNCAYAAIRTWIEVMEWKMCSHDAAKKRLHKLLGIVKRRDMLDQQLHADRYMSSPSQSDPPHASV